MHKFLSTDWMAAYKDAWNANEDLKSGLSGFNARIKYSIDGRDAPVELNIESGVATSSGPAADGKYDFELWASLDNWKALASGDLGPKTAMMTKKLNFKGSMMTAMKYMGGFEKSLMMMSEIPTDWDV